MVKYLVKVTYTGSADNPNFAGAAEIWFEGKGEHSVRDSYDQYFINKWGYSRKCDALKNWHFHHTDDDDSFWYKEIELVKVVL